jgi:hypothetical protein
MNLRKTCPKQAALAALAGVAGLLLALAVLPGCKKAAKPAGPAAPKPAAGAAAAGTNSSARAATNLVAGVFDSVFDDRLPPENKGRDPFNPDSTARNPAPVEPKTTVATGPVDPQLKLQGVAGSPGRRVAVINGHILTIKDPPETIKVAGGGAVTVKVVEIGEDYADVTVEGTAGKKRLTMEQKK